MLACHPCLSQPLMPAAPRQEDSTWWQADWSGRLLGTLRGKDGRRMPEDLKQAKIFGENSAGRETFLEKGPPSPCPTLPKIFADGSAAAEPAQGWKNPQRGRAAAIPKGHVMALQEPECTAREGRDIRQMS